MGPAEAPVARATRAIVREVFILLMSSWESLECRMGRQQCSITERGKAGEQPLSYLAPANVCTSHAACHFPLSTSLITAANRHLASGPSHPTRARLASKQLFSSKPIVTCHSLATWTPVPSGLSLCAYTSLHLPPLSPAPLRTLLDPACVGRCVLTGYSARLTAVVDRR